MPFVAVVPQYQWQLMPHPLVFLLVGFGNISGWSYFSKQYCDRITPFDWNYASSVLEIETICMYIMMARLERNRGERG